ncbi:MAG: hypothetical protein JST92_11110 [Deltaproteobacteria bacterium]|nr:hypothetical protein [Deltaproteobacteria bacterium]
MTSSLRLISLLACARLACALLSCTLLACAPDLSPPATLVDHPRVLAVLAEPPEARPGDRAVFRVLLATPTGEESASSTAWSFCAQPPPLGSNAPVDPACAQDQPPIATGAAASLALPSNGCSRFGPVAASDHPRAQDADPTGGYFQPVRVSLADQLAFAFERLRCPLAQASLAASQEFERRYTSNTNPRLLSLDAAPTAPAGEPSTVPAGTSVTLTVRWTPDSAEAFPLFDPPTQTFTDVTEELTTSWYASAGAFDAALTADSGAQSSNRWTAPAAPGTVYVWAVVRDSRGGTASLSRTLTVPEPP